MNTNASDPSGRLIPPPGGCQQLRSFRSAQFVYDATVLFCERFLERRSRTYDQMVQAARSGVQNIAEASMASATSKKTELKLTNVARASLSGDAPASRNAPARARFRARAVRFVLDSKTHKTIVT
jgi:hypothetical protein